MINRFLATLLLCFIATTASVKADFEFSDLACETTTTTGTGTLNLAGALTNYLSFLTAGIDSGDTVPYSIASSDSKRETGTGTFTDATPDTLARTDVLYSSDGADTALNLPAGTHRVCVSLTGATFNAGLFAPWFGSIELGAATDTTIARSAAGRATVESKPIITQMGVQAFTSGDGTYTPTAGSQFFKVTCTGEGGGGGGSDDDGSVNAVGVGGGGEGGGTTIAWMTSAEMGADAAYSIGDGGGGGGSGTNGTAGTDGDDTTFNPAGTHATLTAAGGDGGDGSGVAGASSVIALGGAAEGTATNGDVNIPGGAGDGGSQGNNGTDGVNATGGAGGGTVWGSGGAGVTLNSSSGAATGAAGVAPGTGGQGGMSIDLAGTGGAGGAGKDGICVVEEYGS